MKFSRRWSYYVMATIASLLFIAADIPAAADTYHLANFSGAINPGNANVKDPFNAIINQGGPITGNYVYDDQLIPAAGSGFQNVFFSGFPDIKNIPAATAFTINLGAQQLTFNLANAANGSGAIQYNNGNFNGFFFQADFSFQGKQYQFDDQGGSWNIQELIGGVPTFQNLVTGFINLGNNNLGNIQPFVPVPLPAALLLFSSGLVGLMGLRKQLARS